MFTRYLVLLVMFEVIQFIHCEIKFLGLHTCDVAKDPIQEGFVWKMNFNNGFNVKIDSPYDLNDDWRYELKIFTYKNKTWKKADFELEGLLSAAIETYFSKAFTKMADILKIAPSFPIKKGKYELKNFKLGASDIDLPLHDLTKAHYLLQVVYTYMEKPMTCYQYELDIK